jgi:type I restriction enzyme M protein
VVAQTKLSSGEVTRDELNSLVDRAADLIRTAVDYKFILVLLFLKRLNDLWRVEEQDYIKRLVKEAKLSEKEAQEEAHKTNVYHSFNIPKEFLWDEATKDITNLPQKLATAISETAKLNKELQGVINRVDFLEFARNQENRELLRQLVELFNRYDLAGKEVSPDVLGDAYEHILMKFAPQKAKEGEIYTPREVIKLLVEILDPQPGQKVYDPCCGSGGMLIESHHRIREKFGEEQTRKLFLYGQERSPEIYAVCQMNLILHDIKNAEIANGDTLDHPKLMEGDSFLKGDLVMANPPWNQDGYDEDRLKRASFKQRFDFGFTAISNADWAWVQHMLASTNDAGRLGLVIDATCLSRSGKDKVIRSKIVEKDWIECVILTPEKLFYNTGAAGAIIIFNKRKPARRASKILFVNAGSEFIRHPSLKRLNILSIENIKSIFTVYRNFEEHEGYSALAGLDHIRRNDYDLSVTLYAMTLVKEERINVAKTFDEFENLEKDRMGAIAKLRLIEKFGIPNTSKSEFKDTDVGKIPSDWTVESLRDVIVEAKPGFASGKRDKNGILQLRMNSIGTNGELNLDGGVRIPVPRSVDEYLLKKGDVLFNNTNSVDLIGKTAVFNGEFQQCVYSNHITRIRVRTDKVLPEWIVYVFLRKWRRGYFKAICLRHVHQAGISEEKLKRIRLPIPSLEEQRRILDVLLTVDRVHTLAEKEETTLEAMKRGFLDSLLDGEVRVKVN